MLFVDRQLAIIQAPVRMKSALQLLKEEAQKSTREGYAQACGVPQATLERLAERFASYGKKAVAIAHGGMM